MSGAIWKVLPHKLRSKTCPIDDLFTSFHHQLHASLHVLSLTIKQKSSILQLLCVTTAEHPKNLLNLSNPCIYLIWSCFTVELWQFVTHEFIHIVMLHWCVHYLRLLVLHCVDQPLNSLSHFVHRVGRILRSTCHCSNMYIIK